MPQLKGAKILLAIGWLARASRYHLSMVIMGIDPGSRVTGYGIIRSRGNHCSCLDYGVIRTVTSKKVRLPQRLNLIFNRISSLLNRHSPDILAVEEVFHATNVRSALVLGQARGIILLAAARAEVTLVEYSALEVKKSVVGYGRADKQQVQLMVSRLLNLPEVPEPHDAADALAIALCRAFGTERGSSTSSWRKLRPKSLERKEQSKFRK